MIKITNLGGPKAVEIGTLVVGETFLNVDGQVCIVLRNMETYTDIFCIETLEAKNMWRESLVVPIQCELKWWPK